MLLFTGFCAATALAVACPASAGAGLADPGALLALPADDLTEVPAAGGAAEDLTEAPAAGCAALAPSGVLGGAFLAASELRPAAAAAGLLLLGAAAPSFFAEIVRQTAVLVGEPDLAAAAAGLLLAAGGLAAAGGFAAAGAAGFAGLEEMRVSALAGEPAAAAGLAAGLAFSVTVAEAEGFAVTSFPAALAEAGLAPAEPV